jgi:hypothetical protein
LAGAKLACTRSVFLHQWGEGISLERIDVQNRHFLGTDSSSTRLIAKKIARLADAAVPAEA